MARVLIVDDEPAVRRIIEHECEGESFGVVTAANAGEALQIFAREPVSVVVADHRMPGLTGIDLLSQIRARFPAVLRVLMVTRQDRHRALDAAETGVCFQFVTKPWEFKELRLIVRSAIELYDLRAENRALAGALVSAGLALEDTNPDDEPPSGEPVAPLN